MRSPEGPTPFGRDDAAPAASPSPDPLHRGEQWVPGAQAWRHLFVTPCAPVAGSREQFTGGKGTLRSHLIEVRGSTKGWYGGSHEVWYGAGNGI